MILEIRQEADGEIESSFLYYEAQTLGLGFQFLAAIEESYRRILSNPKAWTVIEHGQPPLRRYLAKRFPYGLIYMLKGSKIIIVAVMHLSRKPWYWRKRYRSPEK